MKEVPCGCGVIKHARLRIVRVDDVAAGVLPTKVDHKVGNTGVGA